MNPNPIYKKRTKKLIKKRFLLKERSICFHINSNGIVLMIRKYELTLFTAKNNKKLEHSLFSTNWIDISISIQFPLSLKS